MAGLLDLFSGRSSDIYGNGLLTPEQRAGLGNIGLLALAGKLGQLAGPSFSPVPDFGAALGQAAGAYGASQEGAGTAALNAILTGQKGRKLEQELDYYKQLGPVLGKLAGDWPGAGGGTAATPKTGSTGGGAGALTPGGALTGNPGSLAMAETPEVQEAVAHKLATTSGIQHWASFNPKLYSALQSAGLPTSGPLTEAQWQQANPLIKQYESAGGQNIPNYRFDATHTAGGTHQITNSTWNSIGGPAIAASMRGAAPTAAAPAPAGGGGPLAVPAPNPLSDAEPMVGIPRPKAPAGAGPAAQAVPWAPGNLAQYARPGDKGGPITVEGVTYPSVSAWNRGMDARARATAQSAEGFPENPEATGGGTGQGAALEEPPGFAGRQLVAQLLARPPIDDVSQYRQVAGPGAADAAATPRAPLPVMGPTGVELPPMQGPLAAPAPAAAAPAAPGPGLLSPPGALPAAPALPRLNPAVDAYARQLAVAAGLVKGAGLPDALTPLLEMFKSSPAYRAQQIIAEKTVAQPFEQAQTLFNKQVEIAGVGPIEAAKLPYALAQAYFKAEQDIRTAGPVAAAQNFERIRADNAAKGIITTKDADGQIKLSIDPDAVKAVTGATITAPKQAEADIARKTTELQQQGERTGSLHPAQLPDGTNVYVDANGMVVNDPRTSKPLTRAEDPAVQAGRTKAAETGTQRAFDQLQSAEEAQFGLQSTARVRPLIDKMIAGPGADARLEFGRYLKAAGLSSGEDVVATQTYLINQLDQASRIAKRFGSGAGITERDVENAQKLAGGNAALDKDTLRNILDMIDRANRRALELQHQGYDRLTDGGKTQVDRSLHKVAIPIYTSDHVAGLPAGTPVINPKGDRGTVIIDADGNRSIEPARPR